MLLLCVAGAAGVPLPAGSSAGVLSASGDNAASNDAAPARYLFLHIPKTGGISFVDDAAEHALVSCGHLHCVHVDERQKKWEGDGLPQLAASPWVQGNDGFSSEWLPLGRGGAAVVPFSCPLSPSCA